MLVSHRRFFRIFVPVEYGMAAESCRGACSPNVVQDDFVTGQRLTCPVCADQTEHAMFDQVPFRRAGREMTNCDGQPELIGETLALRRLATPIVSLVSVRKWR